MFAPEVIEDLDLGVPSPEERALEEVNSLFGEPYVTERTGEVSIHPSAVGFAHYDDWDEETWAEISPAFEWAEWALNSTENDMVEALPGVEFDPADWQVTANQDALLVSVLAHYLYVGGERWRYNRRQIGNRVVVVQLTPQEVIVLNGHHRIAKAMIRRETVPNAVLIVPPVRESDLEECIDLSRWMAGVDIP